MPSQFTSLGQILQQKYTLTHAQLEEGLVLQKEKGGRIGEILVRLKYIKEEELFEALSLQMGIPYLPTLEAKDIDTNLIEKVPIGFAKQYELIPVKREDGKVLVATSNPMNLYPLDDLRILLSSDITIAISLPKVIVNCINQVYDRASERAEQVIEDLSGENLDLLASELKEPEDLLEVTDEAPIIRLVNSLLFQAVKERASDIHFEPFEREIAIRYRIDGVLYNILSAPKRVQSSIISRIKIMASLNIAEKRLPQDGRIGLKIAGRDIDVRVSVVPTAHGERAVLRLLDKSTGLLRLEEIGLSKAQLGLMEQLIHMSHGIILVTGPTGSGKTTTLYAALSKINSPDKNIITIEDPIEYQLKGIGQMQVNPKINLTFANGLRSILRQDPDVIMVGEIRDTETAEIAIHASLTGHLVFSTLHTNDAAGAITRLIDMGIEPFLVSSSITAIIAQRLVRLVCPECRQGYSPSAEELIKLGLYQKEMSLHDQRSGLSNKENIVSIASLHPAYKAALAGNNLTKGKNFYRGKGCLSCMNTGYRGRTGIYEILLLDDELRNLILTKCDANTIKNRAKEKGMINLREDGARKVMEGLTTTEEILRVTQQKINEAV